MRLDLRRQYNITCEVTLPNGDVINLIPPTKGIADRFPLIGQAIVNLYNEELKSEEREAQLVYLTTSATELLNRNQEDRKFLIDDVENIFTTEQIIEFLAGYAEFIKTIINQKN